MRNLTTNNAKRLMIGMLCIILCFQPQHDGVTQSKADTTLPPPPLPPPIPINVVKTAISQQKVRDTILQGLKDVGKKIDKKLGNKIIYRTKWKTKVDTVYIVLSDTQLAEEDGDSITQDGYIYEAPPALEEKDSIEVLKSNRSWFRKLFKIKNKKNAKPLY